MSRFIYKISFPNNPKVYIGQTTNVKRRWRRHRNDALAGSEYHIHRALCKYGIENAIFEIISSCLEDTNDCGNQAEVDMITQYDSFLNGYNMTPGGYTRNISGENNPMWGKKHTEETKEKNRLANRGENNPGYGKCRTNETKEKIRVANLGDKNPRYGKPGTMLGKTMSNCSRELIRISKIGTTSSEETKEKLRIARRGKTPARSHIWKIYRTNNRIDLTDHRKEWCVDNGYSDSQLSSLFHGKIKHYKDIIKVEKLT